MAVMNVARGTHYAKTNDVNPYAPEPRPQPTQKADRVTVPPATDTYESPGVSIDSKIYNPTAVRFNQSQREHLDGLGNQVDELLRRVGKKAMVQGEGPVFSARAASRLKHQWDLLIDNGNGTFSFNPRLSPEEKATLRAEAAQAAKDSRNAKDVHAAQQAAEVARVAEAKAAQD